MHPPVYVHEPCKRLLHKLVIGGVEEKEVRPLHTALCGSFRDYRDRGRGDTGGGAPYSAVTGTGVVGTDVGVGGVTAIGNGGDTACGIGWVNGVLCLLCHAD